MVTSRCAGSRFDGPALLLYLAFLAGLVISISTLAAGFLCTPPSPESRGCWAALRRRITSALCWDSSGTPRSAHGTPSHVSEDASVYDDLDDSSREMRGLRVFTGVVRPEPPAASLHRGCRHALRRPHLHRCGAPRTPSRLTPPRSPSCIAGSSVRTEASCRIGRCRSWWHTLR